MNGWIEKLYANTDGMVIEEGKPLFDLYSPELTIAVDELIAAHRQMGAMAQDATAKSLVDTSRRKLLQYGLTEAQVDDLAKLETAPRTVPILAPISGHLTVKMVYEGAAVKAGDLVLRLASRHRIWIDAQVYEQQMPLISDGQPVRATLVSQPGKTFKGKVLFVHPHVDPATRTAQVRIEIANEGLHLRQGMYASVDILADDYQEAIVVPREAVIDSGRRQIAFVSLGQGRFEPRDLTLGTNGQDGTVQVLTGLKEGERVVTSGQFLLDSESRMREAISKFSSGPAPEEKGGTPALAMAEPSTRPAANSSSAAASVDKVIVPHTDDILRAYLAIAKTLGARQVSAEPIDVSPLVDSAAMSEEHANNDARPLAAAVRDAAAALKDKPVEAQRQAFVRLSDAVIALARRSRPSAAVASKLYLLNCPMAFDRGEGANWIQTTETVENPYYATSMKRCGSVVETLEPGK
jgi:RND family efflux transporter MFP subunit